MGMPTRRLLHWQLLNARRSSRWWTSRWLVAIVAGGALAALVAWRASGAATETSNVVGASHVWLAGTVAAFALAFMRVPFHLYWRPDAALLAQLPIDGGPLFDVALLRCVVAALATFAVAVIGAIPLALLDERAVAFATRTLQATPIAGDTVPHLTAFDLFVRHVELAGALAAAAALLLPAVAHAAAMIVAQGVDVVGAATAIGGAPARKPASQPPPGTGAAGAILGALPGFASSVIFVTVLIETPWLTYGEPPMPAPYVLGALVSVSVLAIAAARTSAPRVMGTILRDVSALDRQRLATLEVNPPTAIERAVARLIGDAALPYRKDARLMRRRYPMAFALGALAVLVLAIVGIAQPDDPMPWLVATFAGAAMYAAALATRLRRPPIELPRLSATLPITVAARRRAKLAWIITWSLLFVGIPGAFALVRNL